MKPALLTLLLVAVLVGSYGSPAIHSDIDVTILDGPSKTPETKCFHHEMVELGDLVVLHFNASYHESSPSGTVGQYITGSRQDRPPMLVPIQNGSWDLALLGLCEDDLVALKIPPGYVGGRAFAGKKVPRDAIVAMQVHILDILVDSSNSDDDGDWDKDVEEDYLDDDDDSDSSDDHHHDDDRRDDEL